MWYRFVTADRYEDYQYTNRREGVFVPELQFEDSLQNSLEFFENCVQTGTHSLSGPDPSIRVMKVLEWAEKDMKPGLKNK